MLPLPRKMRRYSDTAGDDNSEICDKILGYVAAAVRQKQSDVQPHGISRNAAKNSTCDKFWRHSLADLDLHINTATMAVGSAVVTTRQSPAGGGEELSDAQIDQLLAKATARLQQKSTGNDLLAPSGDRSKPFYFPKLNTGTLDKPYVSTKDDVTTIDAPRLLAQRLRKQANGFRKVEDPVVAKKLAIEVSPSIESLFTSIRL